MKLRSMLFGGFLAVAGLALATPAHAAFITGTASLTSLGVLNGVLVTPGNIDWTLPSNPPPNAVPTYGNFFISGGVSQSFATLSSGGPFEIQDLSSVIGDGNYTPVGTYPATNPDFLRFGALAPQSAWNFTQTYLQPGNLDPTTPFILHDNGGTSSVDVVLRGIAWIDGTPQDVSEWVLILTAQFTKPLAQVLAEFANGQSQNVGWSGTITATAVPEPATLLTFGLGSMYLARRRRNQKKS